ncbi:MAG TPA: hypothetical protein VNI02_11945 [Blastocatellia bacterium]|nr:hypothetical protein [Blastocatellia bacterium]
MAQDQIDTLLMVVTVFEKLGITYLIGGSYASSAHGLVRATRDVDLLAAIEQGQVSALAADLHPEFYADPRAIKHAVLSRRHFNIIHIETAFKIDVFVAKAGGFDEKQLERRQAALLGGDTLRKAYVATPEDTILAKLEWYRRGNEVSDQQWRDILGVVKVQSGKLDLEYLRHWARELAVSDLLEQALAYS